MGTWEHRAILEGKKGTRTPPGRPSTVYLLSIYVLTLFTSLVMCVPNSLDTFEVERNTSNPFILPSDQTLNLLPFFVRLNAFRWISKLPRDPINKEIRFNINGTSKFAGSSHTSAWPNRKGSVSQKVLGIWYLFWYLSVLLD